MKFVLFVGLLLTSLPSYAAITIEGTVTDGQGHPVSKCDVYFNKEKWIDSESIHATCDNKGHYEAQIEPGLYNSLYICDEEKYGKTALEFWGWNLNLIKSQVINAAFDTIEVYSLSTWASNGGSRSIFASFRPMQLKDPAYYNMDVNSKTLAILDITPEITNGSIKGSIDNTALELLSFNWAYEELDSCSGFPEELNVKGGCYMPMIIAQFRKPKLDSGQHTLKIQLTDDISKETGEGITHFRTNKSGYGF